MNFPPLQTATVQGPWWAEVNGVLMLNDRSEALYEESLAMYYQDHKDDPEVWS